MPDEIIDLNAPELTETETELTDPTPPAPSPAPASAAPTTASKKVVQVTTDTFARIKNESREAGKKATLAELDQRARELGFANHAEMVEFAAKAKRGQAEPPAASSQRPGQPREGARKVVTANRYEKERQGWENERARLNRLAAHSDKKRRALQRQYDALQAEVTLREQAIRAGVEDVDYALHLLKKEYSGKSADELKSFDEKAFFDGLRERAPQLFVIERRLATTGTGSAGEAETRTQGTQQPGPKPPANPPAAKPNGNGTGAVDARKISREEYNKRLEELGYKNPALGGSY